VWTEIENKTRIACLQLNMAIDKIKKHYKRNIKYYETKLTKSRVTHIFQNTSGRKLANKLNFETVEIVSHKG